MLDKIDYKKCWEELYKTIENDNDSDLEYTNGELDPLKILKRMNDLQIKNQEISNTINLKLFGGRISACKYALNNAREYFENHNRYDEGLIYKTMIEEIEDMQRTDKL